MLWAACVARIIYPFTYWSSNMTETTCEPRIDHFSIYLLPCKELWSTCKLSTNICLVDNMTFCQNWSYFFQQCPKNHEDNDRRQTADQWMRTTASLDWPGAVDICFVARNEMCSFSCNISTQKYVHGLLLQTATLMGRENWRWFDWIAFVSCNVYIMRIQLHRLHVAERVVTYSLRITWITMITTPHKNRHCDISWGQAPK